MSDIEKMPYDMLWQAFYAMETLIAEETLQGFMISAFPNLKEKSQRDLDSKFSRLTRVHRESELRTMTPEELAYGMARKQLDGQ